MPRGRPSNDKKTVKGKVSKNNGSGAMADNDSNVTKPKGGNQGTSKSKDKSSDRITRSGNKKSAEAKKADNGDSQHAGGSHSSGDVDGSIDHSDSQENLLDYNDDLDEQTAEEFHQEVTEGSGIDPEEAGGSQSPISLSKSPQVEKRGRKRSKRESVQSSDDESQSTTSSSTLTSGSTTSDGSESSDHQDAANSRRRGSDEVTKEKRQKKLKSRKDGERIRKKEKGKRKMKAKRRRYNSSVDSSSDDSDSGSDGKKSGRKRKNRLERKRKVKRKRRSVAPGSSGEVDSDEAPLTKRDLKEYFQQLYSAKGVGADPQIPGVSENYDHDRDQGSKGKNNSAQTIEETVDRRLNELRITPHKSETTIYSRFCKRNQPAQDGEPVQIIKSPTGVIGLEYHLTLIIFYIPRTTQVMMLVLQVATMWGTMMVWMSTSHHKNMTESQGRWIR